MKRVLIIPISATSHYYASFGFARTLRQLGVEVVYGGHPRFRKIVDENGFYLLNMVTDMLADNDKWAFSMFFSVLKSYWKKLKQPINTYCDFCDELQYFENKVRKLEPDVVFLDACLSRYAIPLYKHNTKTIILQLMLPTRRDQGIPPHNCFMLYGNNKTDKVKVSLLWWKNYQRNLIDSLLRKLLYGKNDPKHLLLRWAKEENLPLHNIIKFRKKEVYDQILHTHELTLTPKEFDFPWKKVNRYIHAIGPFIDTSRTVDNDQCDFTALQLEVLENDRFEKIVFCSFGTMPALQQKSDKMIQKVISLFKNKPHIGLIVSTGSNTSLKEISQPDNVFLFERVPQIRLLAYCNLMIGHGGLNSVFECIMQKVPMLVIPLTTNWDTPGICARVVYHQIGLKLAPNKCTVQNLDKKIQELLINPLYKHKISLLSNLLAKKDLLVEVSMFMNSIEKFSTHSSTVSPKESMKLEALT